MDAASEFMRRANARPSAPAQRAQQDEKPKQDSGSRPEQSATTGSSGASGDNTHRPDSEKPDLLSRFDSAGPKINRTSTVPTSQPRREQREVAALHKRFDKLEALLDSSLISSNLDYASHPAFQQLVQTGISTSTVAGWFGSIIKEGIDPYDQTSVFMSKLSGIIRDAIRCETDRQIQKYLLFTGPAGAGKTQLIMKLAQHPEFMKNKYCGGIASASVSSNITLLHNTATFLRGLQHTVLYD